MLGLTRSKNQSPAEDTFPTGQFLVLEPVAVTSIFPYAWLMVKQFGMADASFWAGVLIASFSLTEALCSLLWGGLSDRIGRRPVLLFGCFGTMISLMIVGFSTSFTMALAGRILGGALNGNIGTHLAILWIKIWKLTDE
ncbi:hypothetical protein FOPE_04862 [Fonsecaea pedrosoi]|nr:hypothetical protein FOPE_04862 [Fonsecaea pedrosoi]